MTSKKYFYMSVGLSFFIILVIVSFNIYMNEYGLFGSAEGKSIKIWNNERTTKYLLSYNYIPANFEGLLIGPSVSDNIDTKGISKFKIYNASLNGGNISELKYIAENVILKGNLKFIIICIYPYITKDHGRKTSYINPQEYWGSLGSKETLCLYLRKVLPILGFCKYDLFNDYGHKDFNRNAERTVNISIQKKLPNSVYAKNQKSIIVDRVAYEELAQIVNLSRQRGLKVFAYYYPCFIENYNEAAFKQYKEKIDKIFTVQDIIWNMNTYDYFAFRSDVANYYDKGHLSYKGIDFIVHEINDKLTQFYGSDGMR